MNQTSTTAPPGNEPDSVTARSYFGHRLRVLPRDTIGSALLQHGLYDRKGVCAMLAVLQRFDNAIALDIGANIGNHSLAMSTVARQVYSFEPQSGIFHMLHSNIVSNGIDNIEAFNIGLSSRDQQLDLYIPASDNNGAATLRRELRSEQAITETIELRQGDAVVHELHLSHLDLIKIDVEGFEIEVLEGLEATITRFQPVIFMEWDQQITRDEAASSVLFQKLLRQYRPLYIGSNYDRDQWPDSAAGKLRRALYKLGHPRKWLLRPADLQERFSNLLLVPPQRLDRVMAIGPISLEQPQ